MPIDPENISTDIAQDLINLFLKPRFSQALPAIPKYITNFISKYFQNLERPEINFEKDELKNLDSISLYLHMLQIDLISEKEFQKERPRIALYFDNILYKMEFISEKINLSKELKAAEIELEKEFSKLHALLSDGAIALEEKDKYAAKIDKSKIPSQLKEVLKKVIADSADDEDSLISALKTIVNILSKDRNIQASAQSNADVPPPLPAEKPDISQLLALQNELFTPVVEKVYAAEDLAQHLGLSSGSLSEIEAALFSKPAAIATLDKPTAKSSDAIAEPIFEKWFVNCSQANGYNDPQLFLNFLRNENLDFATFAMSDDGIDNYYKNSNIPISPARSEQLIKLIKLTNNDELSPEDFQKNLLMSLFRNFECASLTELTHNLEQQIAQQKKFDEIREGQERQAKEAIKQNAEKETEMRAIFKNYLTNTYFVDVKNLEFRAQIVGCAIASISNSDFYKNKYDQKPKEFKDFLVRKNPWLEDFFQTLDEQEKDLDDMDVDDDLDFSNDGSPDSSPQSPSITEGEPAPKRPRYDGHSQ